MTEVRFLVQINLIDPADLRAAAQERGYSGAADDIAEMIDEVVINADRPPVETGFEIVSTSVRKQTAEKAYAIDFHLRVTDELAYIKEARQRYEDCWNDADWMPEGLSEAGYEILVASNGNADSPVDLGFEIVDTKYYADVPLTPSVIEAISKIADEDIDLVVPGM